MWFQSYLSDRSFRVNIKNKYSSTAKIECGVPQRSILRPLLFLLCVNDMKQAVNCDLFLYADDSCLVYQHNDVSKIEQNLNKNFSDICNWFVDNKLGIHFGEDKTKCESAKLYAWHACVFACLRSHVLGVFVCLRAYMLGMFACLHACMCVLFMMRAWRVYH